MVNGSPFYFKSIDDYVRDFDLLTHYKRTAGMHLALTKGIAKEEAIKMMDFLFDKVFDPKSPPMAALTREIRGDRKKAKIDFLSYIKWIEENDNILTPNLICYANPKHERSFVAGFIDENLANRKSVKKAGQKAETESEIALTNGNKEESERLALYGKFCGLLQNNFKIRNNSISGATSSPHNPLYYASAHTSLTSVCRAMTSTANSINERMLASNRHYFTPDVVLENISYILANVDQKQVAWAIEEYALQAPSVDFMMEVILKSTRNYWESEIHENRIRRVFENMSTLERCAYLFSGDLYSLQRVNDKVMRDFYSKMMTLPQEKTPAEETNKLIWNLDDDARAMLGCLSAAFMKGNSWDELRKTNEDLFCRVGSHVKNINSAMDKYGLLIRAFFTTNIMPQNLHQLPTIVRAGVAGSDTDSSIFSCQRQVKWFTGSNDTTEKSIPITGLTTFIVGQNIAHNLGLLCAQIGVEKDQLFRATMKSEFVFPVFQVTPKTKHYMASMAVKEGNVYAAPHYEIKGVNLKNSKLPPEIREVLEAFQTGLIDMISRNEDLTLQKVMSVPAAVEHHIKRDLEEDSAAWFKTQQVKTKETYAKPMTSPYRYILWWNEVFGPKYGMVEQLPAPCIAVNVKLPKAKDINEWVDTLPPDMARRAKAYLEVKNGHRPDAVDLFITSLDDPEMSAEAEKVLGGKQGGNLEAMLEAVSKLSPKLAVRGKNFMNKPPFESFTQMFIPMELINDNRLPPEIASIVDDRKVLSSMMQPFYLTMQTTGINMLDKKINTLCSDYFTEDQAKKHLWLEINK